MKYTWCKAGDEGQVMHCKWCRASDALQVMKGRWCRVGDSLLVMQGRWFYAGSAEQVISFRWWTGDSVQVVQNRWFSAGGAEQGIQCKWCRTADSVQVVQCQDKLWRLKAYQLQAARSDCCPLDSEVLLPERAAACGRAHLRYYCLSVQPPVTVLTLHIIAWACSHLWAGSPEVLLLESAAACGCAHRNNNENVNYK